MHVISHLILLVCEIVQHFALIFDKIAKIQNHNATVMFRKSVIAARFPNHFDTELQAARGVNSTVAGL